MTRVPDQFKSFKLKKEEENEEVKPLDSTLTDRAKNVVTSGLSAIAGGLDLPGSMVRDTLAFRNPIDQLLTPFDFENKRTSGRQLARDYGLASDKDTWGNFLGGLVAEIALDPLTYASFGASALTKGGSASAKLGLNKLAPRAATELTGKAVGKSQARQLITPNVLMKYKARGDEKVYNELVSQFRKLGGTDQQLNSSIGGLVKVKTPFVKNESLLNKKNPFNMAAEKLAGKESFVDDVVGAKQFGPEYMSKEIASLKPIQDIKTRDLVKETIEASKAKQAATVATSEAVQQIPASVAGDVEIGQQAAQAVKNLDEIGDEWANLTTEAEKIGFLDKLNESAKFSKDKYDRLLNSQGADEFKSILGEPEKVETVTINRWPAGIQSWASASQQPIPYKPSNQSTAQKTSAATTPITPDRVNINAEIQPKSPALAKLKEITDTFSKDTNQGIAKLTDSIGEAIANSPPGLYAKSLFDRRVRNATTTYGQEKAALATEELDNSILKMRERAAPLVKEFAESKILDEEELIKSGMSNKEAVEEVNKRHDLLVRALEAKTDEQFDQAMDVLSQTGFKGLTDIMSQIRGTYKEYLKMAQEAGVQIEEMDDLFVNYMSRRQHAPAKFTPGFNPGVGKAFDANTIHQKQRTLDDIPGGTAILNKISTDADISGYLQRENLLNKNLTPSQKQEVIGILESKGYLREIEDQASVMVLEQELKKNQAALKAAKTAGQDTAKLEETIDSLKGNLEAVKKANAEKVNEVVGWATKLDPQYANLQMPFYGRNIVQNFMDYTENMERVIGTTRLVRSIINESAVSKELADSIKVADGITGVPEVNAKKYTEVAETLKEMGLDGGRTLEVLVKNDLKDVTEPMIQRIAQIAEDRNQAILSGQKGLPSLGDDAGAVDAYNRMKAAETALNDAVEAGANPRTLRDYDRNFRKEQGNFHRYLLKDIYIPNKYAAELTRYLRPTKTRQNVAALMDGYDRLQNMWKASMTAIFPAFHVRNLLSGQANNVFAGAYDFKDRNPLKLMNHANELYTSGVIKGAAKEYEFLKPDDFTGEWTDKIASDYISSLIFTNGLIGGKLGLSSELLGDQINKIASQYPGLKSPPNVLKGEFTKAPEGTTWGAALNPFNMKQGLNPVESIVEGVQGFKNSPQSQVSIDDVLRPVGANEDIFLPTRIGQDISSQVEANNRIAPFLGLLKKGHSPSEAADLVKTAQVDYSKLSDFEKEYMRRIFPFYSYSQGIAKFTGNELTQNPGGAMSQTIQAVESMRDPDANAPDYIRETASIPIMTMEDGTQRYLTGFGLGFEDPAQFGGLLKGDLRQAGREAASRMNPLLKAPIEYLTGASLYQDGPFGGRAIEDLDPPVGRTLSNISDLLSGERTVKPDPFISQDVEFILANSPLARVNNTARTVTDPRKWENPLALLTNVFSGVKISDVSPGAQDAILRERAAKELKRMGGRTFTTPYLPEDRLARMSEEEATKAEALKNLLKALSDRAKQRRLQEQAQ